MSIEIQVSDMEEAEWNVALEHMDTSTPEGAKHFARYVLDIHFNGYTSGGYAELQSATDLFNNTYAVAVTSSDPDAYFRATLHGRHLVNKLVELGLVNDDEFKTQYAALMKEQDGQT